MRRSKQINISKKQKVTAKGLRALSWTGIILELGLEVRGLKKPAYPPNVRKGSMTWADFERPAPILCVIAPERLFRSAVQPRPRVCCHGDVAFDWTLPANSAHLSVGHISHKPLIYMR